MSAKPPGKMIDNPCDKKIKCKILQIEETKYRTTFTKKFENRKTYVAHDPGKIISYLPGTIIDVLVKPGQDIKQGKTLVILEAMKMMNKIVMPANGKIKTVHVKKGDVIAKGRIIVEIILQ